MGYPTIRTAVPTPEFVMSRHWSAALAVALLAGPPAASRAEEKAKLDTQLVRLLVPIPEIERRLGTDDPTPLANYTKAVQKEATEFWAKTPKPKADGLLITIGIKPGKKARVWCEAVAGEIPAEVLTDLEERLSKITPCDTKENFAYSLECRLGEKEAKGFPIIPKAWADASKGAKKPPVVQDEMFPIVWKD
jgi:hypothetical protein